MALPVRHTLDQLLVLEAVAQTGSFAGAARALHRVPSAISYTVRALEETLDVALFDRRGHHAELTPAGRSLLDAAGEVLRRARSLEVLAQSLSAGWEPELQVVIDGIYPMQPVADCLRTFSEQRVPTRLRVDVEYQDGVPDRFEADRAQMMMLLDFPGDDRLAAVALPPLELALLAAPTHPLARGGAFDRPALLQHVELVVKDSSPRYARAPRRAYMGSQHVIYLSDFHAKRLALLAGAGFGWMPLHLAEHDLREGALVLLDFAEGNRWTYRPSLVTRRDEPLGRAGRLFVALLLAAVAPESKSLIE